MGVLFDEAVVVVTASPLSPALAPVPPVPATIEAAVTTSDGPPAVLGVNTFVSARDPVYSSLSQSPQLSSCFISDWPPVGGRFAWLLSQLSIASTGPPPPLPPPPPLS